MKFSEKFEAAINDDSFIASLENAHDEAAVKALMESKGIDIEKELSSSSDEELTEGELDSVMGGISLSAGGLSKALSKLSPTKIWKYAVDFGIISRAYYDTCRYGDATRSYSKERIYKAAKNLGLE